jgi:hypothetical protein
MAKKAEDLTAEGEETNYSPQRAQRKTQRRQKERKERKERKRGRGRKSLRCCF